MQSFFRIILQKSAFLLITRAFWVHKSAFFPKKVKPTPIFSPKSRATENPQYDKTQIYTQKYKKAQKTTNLYTKRCVFYKNIRLLSHFERGISF
jgi:hypothetical protein